MAEKLDRRVRKTRKLLLDSLTTLLKTKDLKDITVKEICECADLNRGTFYLHYNDVFHMMSEIQKELFNQFNDILSECAPTGKKETPYPFLYQVFEFIEENKEYAKAVMGPHGDYQFILSLTSLVKEHIAEVWSKNNYEMENFEFFYSYCVSGIIGMIQYWLESGSSKTPKEMATLVNDILCRALTLFDVSNVKKD